MWFLKNILFVLKNVLLYYIIYFLDFLELHRSWNRMIWIKQ